MFSLISPTRHSIFFEITRTTWKDEQACSSSWCHITWEPEALCCVNNSQNVSHGYFGIRSVSQWQFVHLFPKMDFFITSLRLITLHVNMLAVDCARIASKATLRVGWFEIHIPVRKTFCTHFYRSCGPHSFCTMALGFFQGKAAYLCRYLYFPFIAKDYLNNTK